MPPEIKHAYKLKMQVRSSNYQRCLQHLNTLTDNYHMKTAYKTNRRGRGNTIKYFSYACHPFYKRYINAKGHVKINCQTEVSAQTVILHKATVNH
jgi:hypothetical protein